MDNKTVNWTKSQSAAINLRGRTLLVSAAAGSGKTAVLTERIIKRLTDPKSPGDISRMLVVTFTKAAANELKVRISKAISKAIAENPSNRHLSRQLLLMGSAKICTIHSFCFDIIRKNLSKLSLPEKTGVASEPEMLLCSREIINTVINNAYSGLFEPGYEISDFASFMDIFSRNGIDANAGDLFLDIYRKLMSYPEGVDFLKNWSERLEKETDNSFFASHHGQIIVKNLSERVGYLLLRYKALLEEIRLNDETVYNVYIAPMSAEIDFLDNLYSSLRICRADLAEEYTDAFDIMRLPTLPRGYKSVYTDKYKSLRKDMKDTLEKVIRPLFEADEKCLKETALATSWVLKSLYCVLSAFDICFREEKKRLGKIDFNDIERYAYSLLVSGGEPTDIARTVSDEFDEIYIDEYQDTNSVQDMIFTAVSKPENRFMVGDIKQSIYSFRGAAPEIFARYRDSFEMYDENRAPEGTAPTTIFLSDNFRCDNSVIEFCNRVFSRLFTNNSGRIKYYDSDNLVCSKPNGKDGNFPVNVVLGEKLSDEGDGECEAAYIAGEITRLLRHEKNKDGTPIKPSDIAILVRAKNASVKIEEELAKHGISTTNNVETEFFENPEILLMMSLLNTIDNPMRDIYLAGTLKSPLFNFTLDELVTIRASSTSPSLFEALVEYTEKNTFEKGIYFLDKLSYFRDLTSGTQIDRLIWKLYRECNLFAIVAGNHPKKSSPEQARENLILLYKYARDFEGTSFKGLSAFIEYINDIIAMETKLPAKGAKSASADAVKIMSVHQSKGLEFPVIFLAGAHKTGNMQDKQSPILIDRYAGAAADLTDSMKIAKISTLHKKALEIRMDENRFDEEMRVLYVALTRARERLYITGDFKDREKFISKAKELSENLCPFVIMKNISFMQLILMSLYNSGEGFYNIVLPCKQRAEFSSGENDAVRLPSDAEDIFKKIDSNMSFRYNFDASNIVPSKAAASDLSDTFLDRDFETDVQALAKKISECVPAFLSGDSSLSGAKKGTATHIFMQFCDYEAAEKNGVDGEIARLLNNRFIPPETADLVDRRKAAAFFKSRLYTDIIKPAKKIYREYRFNVRFPASDFTQNESLKAQISGETLFVQGIIDCFIENADGTYTLIDYKTDYIPYDTENRNETGAEILKSRYCPQLSYYKRALEIITKKKVQKVYLYSFSLGCEIDITDSM